MVSHRQNFFQKLQAMSSSGLIFLVQRLRPHISERFCFDRLEFYWLFFYGFSTPYHIFRLSVVHVVGLQTLSVHLPPSGTTSWANVNLRALNCASKDFLLWMVGLKRRMLCRGSDTYLVQMFVITSLLKTKPCHRQSQAMKLGEISLVDAMVFCLKASKTSDALFYSYL